MIDLYYWPTPNGNKITMMLEECELDYTIYPINITAGDQFQPDFLKLSPNNRMPAIVDHDPIDNGQPLDLLSLAPFLYLAEKTGKFYPSDLRSVMGDEVAHVANGWTWSDGWSESSFWSICT